MKNPNRILRTHISMSRTTTPENTPIMKPRLFNNPALFDPFPLLVGLELLDIRLLVCNTRPVEELYIDVVTATNALAVLLLLYVDMATATYVFREGTIAIIK